jgi:hypothetical protein
MNRSPTATSTCPPQTAVTFSPKVVTFDVFGTLISVREGSYAAFQSILAEVGNSDIDVKVFWEHWEHRNIVHYWEPYRRYRDICVLSLAETFDHFQLKGDPTLIERSNAISTHFQDSIFIPTSNRRLNVWQKITDSGSYPTSMTTCWHGQSFRR